MSIRTLCLAILRNGDATGYEIKKLSVEGKYSYFADASFGSIYPTLARLEADGLVTLREEAQAGKPARKIYSITEAGRQALVRELSEEPAPDIFRSSFMLVAICASILPRSVVAAAVEARLAHLDAEIAHLKEIAAASEDAPSRWACEYGVTCIGGSRAYLEAHRAEIEALALPDADTRAPAPSIDSAA
jgi:PadR family transcriptional regulator AphA